MNTDDIIQKSVSGAKWTVILSTVAMPLGYIVNILLGRISPEALGIYGLLNIFILSVTTFILFGGGNVIIKYLPEIGKDKKVSFLASYILIVFLIAIFAIGLIYLYPQILELIFGQDFPLNILPYLIIFIPVIILYSVFDFALNGLMEIKASVIIRKITAFGYFIVFSILFLFYKDFFREHLWMIIWGLSFVFYTVLGLLALSLTTKKMKFTSLNKRTSKNHDREFSQVDNEGEVASWESSWSFRMTSKLKNLKPYLPTKFWSFALFVHLSTIAYFASDKMDQLFILGYFSIGELGLYYAALQTAMVIRVVPMLLGSVLLPTFSNLLASNDIGLIHKGYQKVVRFNTLMVVPAALFCIFFSKEIMGLFGEEYIENYLVLVALASFFSTTSIGVVNNSLIIAKGRAGIYLLGQIITPIFGFVLMLLLINRLGVLGLAIGRGAMFALWQGTSIVIVTMLLHMDIKIPKSYKVGLITALVALLLYLVIPIQNTLTHTVLFLSCLSFFLYFADYSKEDLDFVFRQLFHK
jgi:O-antigen/teichoic acid export membrane protein